MFVCQCFWQSFLLSASSGICIFMFAAIVHESCYASAPVVRLSHVFHMFSPVFTKRFRFIRLYHMFIFFFGCSFEEYLSIAFVVSTCQCCSGIEYQQRSLGKWETWYDKDLQRKIRGLHLRKWTCLPFFSFSSSNHWFSFQGISFFWGGVINFIPWFLDSKGDL